MTRYAEVIPPSLSYGTILVVDDDPASIQVINNILSNEYRVLMATSCEQAIKVCNKGMPDLLLLDVLMPGIGGLETCRMIKNNPQLSHIPIIFITSLQAEEDEEECWSAGGVDFVQKPIKPMTLVNRVKSQLIQKHQADLLHKYAYIDGLTGVYNRRYFDQRLHEQLSLSARNKRPLTLLLLDIDHFKRYNDSKGHLGGDGALCLVAKNIHNCCQRPSDITARYGGEEFALILPDTDNEGAIKVADNILMSLTALNILHPDSVEPYLTVSIGIATTIHDNSKILIEEADKQLFLAKQNGRNRYSMAPRVITV